MNNVIKFKPRKINRNPAPDPNIRLQSAVAKMGAAIAENQKAITGFQTALGVLDLAMKNMENTFENYSHRLERIKVRRLRRRSLRLSGIMDRWLNDHAAPMKTTLATV